MSLELEYIDNPKKEEENYIELTHCQYNGGRWSDVVPDIKKALKVVYLGCCATDGDLFIFYHSNGNIYHLKGYLNNGKFKPQ